MSWGKQADGSFGADITAPEIGVKVIVRVKKNEESNKFEGRVNNKLVDTSRRIGDCTNKTLSFAFDQLSRCVQELKDLLGH